MMDNKQQQVSSLSLAILKSCNEEDEIISNKKSLSPSAN
jgi:hypothetical protein